MMEKQATTIAKIKSASGICIPNVPPAIEFGFIFSFPSSAKQIPLTAIKITLIKIIFFILVYVYFILNSDFIISQR